ncbi:MAG: site-specific DNA-methyltransferase, partial [Firmicutes bacterium]|nr:site-specific DNA-methyltransferase [Bacillota bacterium]
RFHTDWLNFIYPRLWLSRDMLAEDGVIFVSIDDNEVHNLRKVCDEIFGDSNCLASFVWQTKNAARGVPPITMVMSNHEYILCYAKEKSNVKFKGIYRDQNDFDNKDNDPRGLWRSESMKATGSSGNVFEIVNPMTGIKYKQVWAFSQDKVLQMLQEDLLIFPDKIDGVVRQKKFFNSYINDKKAFVSSLGWYSTENSTKLLMDLFDGKKVFDFSKPIELVKFLINQATATNDIILDFFSGSATTAHAVMQLNAEEKLQAIKDGIDPSTVGNRKFVMVQVPEVVDNDSNYKTICDIGKERIRRAGKKIKEEYQQVVAKILSKKE